MRMALPRVRGQRVVVQIDGRDADAVFVDFHDAERLLVEAGGQLDERPIVLADDRIDMRVPVEVDARSFLQRSEERRVGKECRL